MKLYVLSEGSDSDYSIVGIYSSLELTLEAKYRRRGGGGDYYNDPEEYELDQMENIKENEELGFLYECYIIIETGEIKETKTTKLYRNPSKCDINKSSLDNIWMSVKDKYITIKSPISQEHANKVAIEERQKYLREEKQKPRIWKLFDGSKPIKEYIDLCYEQKDRNSIHNLIKTYNVKDSNKLIKIFKERNI